MLKIKLYRNVPLSKLCLLSLLNSILKSISSENVKFILLRMDLSIYSLYCFIINELKSKMLLYT